MQALALLCQTQKESPDYDKWLGAMRLHGEYIKDLMRFTAPYGMIPSGVYEAEE